MTCMLTSAQESTPVEISSDKVILEGQVYYIHIVKKGQTLYSIALAYGVPQKTISKENPDVAFGLMPGQALKIPMQPRVSPQQAKEKSHSYDESQFIRHRIKRGNTLYSISKKYVVSQETIMKYNDVKQDELKIGTLLYIPKKDTTIKEAHEIAAEIPEVDQDYLYHKVERKETLYSLAKRYGVSQSAILESNAGLSDKGLRYGEYIKIPRVDKDTTEYFFTEPAYLVRKDTALIDTDSMIYPDPSDHGCGRIANRTISRPVNVVLLLPFYIEENELYNLPEFEEEDSLEAQKVDTNLTIRNDFRIYPRTFKFLEFYEGLLLAIDSLKQNGIFVNLSVYSTRPDTNTIDAILRSRNLRQADFIIGPAFYDNLKAVAKFCKKNRIYLISPFANSPQELLLDNPYVFKVKPSRNTEYQKIARLLSFYADDNIVLVNHDSLKDSLNMVAFKQYLFNEIEKNSTLANLLFKEFVYSDTVENAIAHSLSTTKNNVVFINSMEEPFVSQVVGELSVLSLQYDITIVGYPVWKWFNNIDIKYFYNLQLKYITPFQLDYSKTEVKHFIRNFRERYYTEPRQFSTSFMGFDVMYYFTTAYARYQDRFPYCLPAMDLNLLESSLKFYRVNPQGGYENLAGSLYHYKPGFKIEETNFFDIHRYFTRHK